ncbi:hypothetical protein MLD38_039960 [Melastoma candidum]|uniref:Uncharacterized protein n=1 Tax=Melastoma candidum TaxID=119954 RepID=A0ACB9L640_9MYRT|nr:hypothetical protein MLD38_039960 [Melastoma candidum]
MDSTQVHQCLPDINTRLKRHVLGKTKRHVQAPYPAKHFHYPCNPSSLEQSQNPSSMPQIAAFPHKHRKSQRVVRLAYAFSNDPHPTYISKVRLYTA